MIFELGWLIIRGGQGSWAILDLTEKGEPSRMANGHGGFRKNSGRKPGDGGKAAESKTQKMLQHIQSHPLTAGFDPLQTLSVFATGQIPDTHAAFVEIATLLSGHTTKKQIDEAKKIAITMSQRPILTKEQIVLAAKEVTQYVYPKLRAVELADPNGNNPFTELAAALAAKVKK